jgi:hypothetical protein
MFASDQLVDQASYMPGKAIETMFDTVRRAAGPLRLRQRFFSSDFDSDMPAGRAT